MQDLKIQGQDVGPAASKFRGDPQQAFPGVRTGAAPRSWRLEVVGLLSSSFSQCDSVSTTPHLFPSSKFQIPHRLIHSVIPDLSNPCCMADRILGAEVRTVIQQDISFASYIVRGVESGWLPLS